MPASPDLQYEQQLWDNQVFRVAGIDEAGRGAWAGPVAAAAVVLPADPHILHILEGVRDSKQMSVIQRAHWAEAIKEAVEGWSVAFASAEEIDALGIVPATRLAITRAVDGLKDAPDHLVIDYLTLPECPLPQTALPKGDCRSLSVAAASVLAKTARDEHMREQDRRYPQYGFARHKGYGTALHQAAIAHTGFSPIHRKSFAIRIKS